MVIRRSVLNSFVFNLVGEQVELVLLGSPLSIL